MRTVFAQDLLATHDTGAVDQPVDRAEGLDRGLYRRLGRAFVADIGHHTVCSQALGLSGNGFGVHVHQHDLGAGAHQQFGGGRTQSGCAAGDDKYLVLDLHHGFLKSSCSLVNRGLLSLGDFLVAQDKALQFTAWGFR